MNIIFGKDMKSTANLHIKFEPSQFQRGATVDSIEILPSQFKDQEDEDINQPVNSLLWLQLAQTCAARNFSKGSWI